MNTKANILVIDLNNFAAYPTLAVGYIIKTMRNANYQVELLSPLAIGAPAYTRDEKENWLDQLQRKVYFSTLPALNLIQDWLRNKKSMFEARPHKNMVKELQNSIQKQPDAILVSAYLTQFQMCKLIGNLALQNDIPLLIGGPFFNLPKVANEWSGIEGVRGVVGAEVDHTLPHLLEDLLAERNLSSHPGVFTKEQNHDHVIVAKPLQNLETLPIPDFSDFPWDKYRHPIIPIMSGRGCSWGSCTFCGDVISANGRTFRSRGIKAVLNELKNQSLELNSQDFIFLDIKLNSDLELWRGLIGHFQDYVPNGRWIGTVHVNKKGENGLSREELIAAKKAGLTRISFGLESGSQRLLDQMKKGADIEECSAFIRNAYDAGISVRASMMLGFPGETAEDIKITVDFMEKHLQYFDRIRLSKFKPIPETPFDRIYNKAPEKFPYFSKLKWDYRLARGLYQYNPPRAIEYRKAQKALLEIVHHINKQPLRDNAKEFNGMM